MRRSSFLLPVLFLFGFTTPSFAQRVDTLKGNKEILIIATPISEDLRRFPMAASVIEDTAFREVRGYELRDALQFVPGVLAQSRSGGSDLRITMRGFGARGAGDRSNSGNLRGIRLIVDGIPETEPDGRTSLDIVDLNAISRVEALRGNASALYGSASGGVLSLSTGMGSTPMIASRNSFGSYGFLKNTLAGTAAFGAGTLFLAASNTTYDGYRPHSNSREGTASIVAHALLDTATTLQTVIAASTNIFRIPGPLSWDAFQANPMQADSTYVANDEHRFDRVGRFGMTIDHLLGGGQEVSATAYYQPKVITRSERGSWREFNRYTIGTMGFYSWTANFSGMESRVMAGFDQQYQDGTIQFWKPLGPGASRSTSLDQDKREAASVMGFFLQEELTLDQFLLSVGARMDNINYNFEDFITTDPQQYKTFDHVSPKLALSYRLTPNHTVYASYGQGVEAPAFNEIDPPDSALIVSRGGTYVPGAVFNPLLGLATSSTIELGARGDVGSSSFIHHVSYDVALFTIQVLNDIIPWNGGAFYFTAGETQRQGAELGLQALFDYNLSLDAAFTMMKTKYVSYENELGHFDGNEMAGVPGLFGTVRVRYSSPFGPFLEGEADYVGQYFADDRNDKKPDGTPDPNQHSLVPASTILNATVGYHNALGPLDLDLFASLRNLTDESYVSGVFINGVDNKYFEPGMPRNLIVGLRAAYAMRK